MIAITGDIHGEHDIGKLSNRNVRNLFGQLPDYLLVAGDFGIPWSNNEDNETDNYYRRWFEEKPYEVAVIKGNHENYGRIENMPIVTHFGAKCRQYSKNIFFVENNEILTIEGKTFYCFGGATSVDKAWRRPYVSWWPQENPSSEDYAKLSKLQGTAVDYVVTHTAPNSIVKLFDKYINDECPTRRLLDGVMELISFKHWYFGHFHNDLEVTPKFSMLYQTLKEV